MNLPEYSPEELAAIREAYAKGASDNDFTLFMSAKPLLATEVMFFIVR